MSISLAKVGAMVTSIGRRWGSVKRSVGKGGIEIEKWVVLQIMLDVLQAKLEGKYYVEWEKNCDLTGWFYWRLKELHFSVRIWLSLSVLMTRSKKAKEGRKWSQNERWRDKDERKKWKMWWVRIVVVYKRRQKKERERVKDIPVSFHPFRKLTHIHSLTHATQHLLFSCLRWWFSSIAYTYYRYRPRRGKPFCPSVML